MSRRVSWILPALWLLTVIGLGSVLLNVVLTIWYDA